MMASSIILMMLCIILTAKGWKEDRYVVRENDRFEVDCIKEIENITRVRWEYKPTHDTRSEIIYDSQSNENLKNGFVVSCQPHQSLISTCILKLAKARKEDSGKYICFVGQDIEAMTDSNLLKRIGEIELVVRGPTHKTMAVNQNDSVILPCEHNIKNLTRARWSHVSLQGVLNYQLYYMDWKDENNNNYKGLCEPHQPACNLKILQAKKESAGIYICMVGESQEFEKKYGMFQMTYFIEIQLVVGELFCNENMNKDLTLIGENDCHGIEADALNLKCSFNYFGNINYNLLHLRWIEKYKFNSLEKKLNSSLKNHEVKDETNKISIQTNLSVAYEMQNSIFQCVLEDTLVKPCQLHEFRTQYIKNTIERSPPMHSNDLHNIKCSANKSENVHCSYYWVHEIAGAMVENKYAILPVENMNSPGNYTCIAKCHIGKYECIIRAMEFEVIPRSDFGLINGIILAVMVTFIITSVCIICIIKFSKRMKRYLKAKIENDSMSSQHVSDLLLNSGRKSLRRRHVKIVTEERKVETPSKGITPKDLHKEDSESNVTICELPDQKQLIDIVRLERIILLPVLCHTSPKSVLVIGKNVGKLVRTLLTYEQVESTTIFEMDERNLILYCEYFPNFPYSLDDPKIKVFGGDGSTFLKSNKQVFDVIINHSSTDKKLNDCLNKEYHKDVKSALKEGGIASLVVSGQDVPKSDDIISTKVKHFCKDLFPMVEYFQIPALNHPTDLTRCLICSLKPETHLKLNKLLEDFLNNPKILP